MENKTLSKVECNDHLPEDLWPNILSRLPSKSLVRFRCISKSCESLINDPDFRRLHLKNFKNNVDETNLLVVKGQQNSDVRCSKTWETKSDAHFNLGGKWDVDSSIDGLVLLKTSTRNYKGLRDLMVWNPSIRKFHLFPPVPETETSVQYFFIDVDIGLGYDPLIKDYKHVKLVFKDQNVLHSVAVYTLGVGSWKIIPFQGKGFCNWHWECMVTCMGSVYLRGCLYFLAWNLGKKMSELVSIDLSSMVFSATSLPDAANFYSRGLLKLVDGGCSLAVWCDGRDDKSIWVLESESMTWTKHYSLLDLNVLWLLYVKKKGDLLLRRATHETNKMHYDIVSSYDLETNEENILQEKECSDCDILKVCGYIESLILLK